MEVFHQGEPRTKIDALARQQTLIQEHEGWRAQAHELQGGQTIRSDDDLACLLRKQLSEPGGNGKVILNKKKKLYGGWLIETSSHL